MRIVVVEDNELYRDELLSVSGTDNCSDDL